MAKWADFETHPVGTSDRIKELEQLVASLEDKLDQAIWETIYWEEHLKNMCNLFAKTETERQVLLGRVEDLEAQLAKAIDALEKVQGFVKDLEPYADQGHTLVPALREACEVLVVLKGEKDD